MNQYKLDLYSLILIFQIVLLKFAFSHNSRISLSVQSGNYINFLDSLISCSDNFIKYSYSYHKFINYVL